MEWLNFSEEMAVEVKFDAGCLNNGWFPATVLRKVQGVNSFLVEYNNSSNKGKDGLTEAVVDSSHIRPSPPNLKVENFKFMDKVDAFYDSAWRLGYVTKVLLEGRYSVFLKNEKHGKQEKELPHSEIRPHLDFINGVWVNASQSMQSSASGQALTAHVNSNAKIPKVAIQSDFSSAANDKIEENTACRNSGKNLMQQPTPIDSVPTLSLEMENSTDLCSHACHVESMQDRQPNQESEATISTNYQLVCNELSTVSENLDTVNNADTNPEEFAADNSVETWETPAKLPVKRQLSLKAENEKENNIGYCAAHVAGVENIINKVDSSLVLASGMGGLPSENFCWIFDKESIQQENVENETIISLEETEISSRPQVKSQSVLPGEYNVTGVNLSGMSIEDSATEDVKSPTECNVTGVDACDMDVEDNATEVIKSPVITGVEPGEYIVNGTHASDMGIEDSATEEDKSPEGTGLEPGGALTETSPLVSSTGYLAKEVNEAAGRTSCSTSNNVQRQSLCSEGNSSDQAVKQWNDTSETEKGTIKQDSVINATVANENQEMPFVKNSAIWDVVESHEVFEIMPQKPHFHPLVEHKELQREAFAIGYMVTFATLADKVRQLEVNSPRNVFDSYLETLDDLKTLGFKVGPLEDRINKLLLIKRRRVKLEEQSKEVEVHLAERRRERTKLEEDIGAIDKELRRLKEKRALAVSAKERKDSKLNSLRKESGVVSVDISKARNDFEMLAYAPW